MSAAGDYERLSHAAGAGTVKLFARQDLWEAPDPERAHSAGDFIGRLVTLFGDPDPEGGFVLRHRATGVIVTASATHPNGPCYGGVARDEQHQATYKEMQKLRDDWDAAGIQLMTTMATGELPSLQLLVARKDAWRRLAESSSPVGYAAVVEELETLVQATELTDYERIDRSNVRAPKRVGVREGVPFTESLPPDA